MFIRKNDSPGISKSTLDNFYCKPTLKTHKTFHKPWGLQTRILHLHVQFICWTAYTYVIIREKHAVCDSFTYGVFVGQTVRLDIPQLHLMSDDSGNPEIQWLNTIIHWFNLLEFRKMSYSSKTQITFDQKLYVKSWYPPWVKDSLLKYPQKMAAFFLWHWSSQVQPEYADHFNNKWNNLEHSSLRAWTKISI